MYCTVVRCSVCVLLVMYCTVVRCSAGYVLYCCKVFCMCPAGYVLGADWQECEDVNECETDNNDCSQLCINVPGNRKMF
jgi:hypothetical protein